MKKKNLDKKAFSLIELIFATSLLSIVMLSLFQIKSNNIFILEKSSEDEKNKEYLSLAMDTQEYKNINKNIYLDRLFKVNNDDLRRELKKVKIKIEDEVLNKQNFKTDVFNFNITEFKTTYSFDKGIKKDVYRFKLEL